MQLSGDDDQTITDVIFRLRCVFCPWQVTITGRDSVRTVANRHIRGHEITTHPLIVHLPEWLLPWRKSV